MIQSKFHSRLRLEEVGVNLNGEPVFELLGPLVYDSARLRCRLLIEPPFRTDLSSVPRRSFVYRLAGGRGRRGGVVHDYLYRLHLLGMFPELPDAARRAIADEVYAEALIVSEGEIPAAIRWAMWAGVRIGGAKAWADAQAPEVRGA